MTVFDDDNEYYVESGRLMQDIFHSGTNYISQGLRGGGKTHCALAFAWGLVNGIWPECGKVVLLTNVIFIKRVAKHPGNPDTDYIDTEVPPGVYRVFSLEDVFRTISQLMLEHPKRDVLYLIILDEAQNFFNGYDARSPISAALQKWFGTLRKFDTCLWMMTPSKDNVPPKGRMFNDDPKHPGYLNGIWSKTKEMTLKSMVANGLEVSNGEKDTRQWVRLQLSYNDEMKRFLKVPVTPWNKSYKELEVGEYTYDHISSADFVMGSEEFSFTELITRCSGVSFFNMPKVLAQYFDDLDNGMTEDGEEDPNAAANRQRALDKFLMLKEMDKMGISERKEAQIFSMPKTTFRRLKESLYKNFGDMYLSEEEREQIDAVKGKHKGVKRLKNDTEDTDLEEDEAVA